jgi:hypothetical protein
MRIMNKLSGAKLPLIGGDSADGEKPSYISRSAGLTL